MAYSARIERFSVSPRGHKIMSIVGTFPRVCLAEVVTHRLNYDTWGENASVCERTTTRNESKNSASSRAIPFQKMVERVMADPFMPMWSIMQGGMQGQINTDQKMIEGANREWLGARDEMIARAVSLHHNYNVHKQDVNRLLEPWQWVTQIITSTNWDNFFALRCHEAAFPPFRKFARMIYLLYRKATPVELDYGQWHLPFVPMEEQMSLKYHVGASMHAARDLPIEIKRSAARCAWISYENHDREAGDDAVNRTYGRLFADVPIHASPIEHQATPMHVACESSRRELRSNLNGWVQARKLVPMEHVRHYAPSDEDIAKWDDVKDFM